MSHRWKSSPLNCLIVREMLLITTPSIEYISTIIIYCIMHFDIIFGKRTGCCYQIFHLLFLHLSSVYTSFVLPPTVYHASVIFFLCIFWLPFSHLLLLSFKLIFTLVSMVFDLKCLSFFFSISIIYIAIVYPVVHH